MVADVKGPTGNGTARLKAPGDSEKHTGNHPSDKTSEPRPNYPNKGRASPKDETGAEYQCKKDKHKAKVYQRLPSKNAVIHKSVEIREVDTHPSEVSTKRMKLPLDRQLVTRSTPGQHGCCPPLHLPRAGVARLLLSPALPQLYPSKWLGG